MDIDCQFKYLENFNWAESVLAEWETKENPNLLKKEEQLEVENEEENESESYSDYKSIYNLIDDVNSESQPQTVIVK